MAEVANKQRKSDKHTTGIPAKEKSKQCREGGNVLQNPTTQHYNPQKTFTEIKDQHIHTERVPGYQSKSKINFNGEKQTNKHHS